MHLTRCGLCRIFLLVVVAQVALVATCSHAADEYSVTVVTDRENGIYEADEEAAFLVSVKHGQQVVTDGTVSYVVDDFHSLSTSE